MLLCLLKKRIAVYKDIQRRNIIRLKRSIKAALVIKLKEVLKVGLCSLYAARATNLLTRVEQMQRRILDWGREVVAVFQEGSENSTLGG